MISPDLLRAERLLKAARDADWTQVVLNQGPPCFHLEIDRFCLRAERWLGHGTDERIHDHAFVPLLTLLASLSQELAKEREKHDEEAYSDMTAAKEKAEQELERIRSAYKALLDAENAELAKAEQELETVKAEAASANKESDFWERKVHALEGSMAVWHDDIVRGGEVINMLKQQLETVKGERDQFREALKRHGQHVYPCPMGGDWMGSSSVVPKEAVCACGLESALLREIRPAIFDPEHYPEDAATLALQRLLDEPKDSRTIHFDEDTIPHGACDDPIHCDCMCPRCWRLKADIVRSALRRSK